MDRDKLIKYIERIGFYKTEGEVWYYGEYALYVNKHNYDLMGKYQGLIVVDKNFDDIKKLQKEFKLENRKIILNDILNKKKYMNSLYIKNFSLDDYDNLISLSLTEIGIKSNYSDNLYIWLGFNSSSDDIRIKITNNKYDKTKTFVINVDTLEVIGEYDKTIISEDDIYNIKRWIKLNISQIHEFSDNNNDGDAIKFLNNLVYL